SYLVSLDVSVFTSDPPSSLRRFHPGGILGLKTRRFGYSSANQSSTVLPNLHSFEAHQTQPIQVGNHARNARRKTQAI
ncbi:MAG: hypothetical protein AB8B55_17035, partial [Mariniblastus sp.]